MSHRIGRCVFVTSKHTIVALEKDIDFKIQQPFERLHLIRPCWIRDSDGINERSVSIKTNEINRRVARMERSVIRQNPWVPLTLHRRLLGFFDHNRTVLKVSNVSPRDRIGRFNPVQHRCDLEMPR